MAQSSFALLDSRFGQADCFFFAIDNIITTVTITKFGRVCEDLSGKTLSPPAWIGSGDPFLVPFRQSSWRPGNDDVFDEDGDAFDDDEDDNDDV